jgi:hypothetical protein
MSANRLSDFFEGKDGPNDDSPDFSDNPDLRTSLAEVCGDDRILFFTGFDHCIVGISEIYGHPPRVAYDVEQLMEALEQKGVPAHEVEDVFENSIASLNVGPYTPALILRVP